MKDASKWSYFVTNAYYCWLLVSDGRGTVPVFTATKQIKENILLQILCSFRNMSLLCKNFEIDNESTRNKK